MRFFLDIVA